MAFKRGLGVDLLDCLLNGETWWQDVVKHENLAIAIRDKSLNVYSNGQSIFKITETRNVLVAKTHFKYLLDTAEKPYRSFENGKFKTEGLNSIQKYEGKKTLDRLINNAKVYAGNEKKAVHRIIRNNSNVIDVEVAFKTLLGGDEDDEVDEIRSDRIDVVALEKSPTGSVRIVFYEVKQFADARIRARETAEVVGTLKDYEDAITSAKVDIITGYHHVCRDLQKIGRQVGQPGKIDSLIKKAADDKDNNVLEIDPTLRLVIIGYTKPAWVDPGWQNQLEKISVLRSCSERVGQR